MSYRDINDYWADRKCVRCDGHLDRRGSFCSSCMEKVQSELEQAEAKEIRTAMVNKPITSLGSKESGVRSEEQWSTLETWKFLDNQFQKIFGPRK